jgi:SAM-dependent methyltransferase
MIPTQKQRDRMLSLMEKTQEARTPEQVIEHYEIEKALAERLRASSSPEERKELYSAVYDEFNKRIPYYAALSNNHTKQAALMIGTPQWNFLRRFLHKNTVFLEVGAGTCAMALTVARAVKKVYALEVSQEVLKHVKGPGNFEALIFDGLSIPPLPEGIDVAYSDQIIEHIHPEDVLEQLKSVYQALLPGGLYVCLTPNGLNGPHDISKYFDLVATGFHLKEYNNTELVRLFQRAGFAQVWVYVGAAGYYIRWPFFGIKLLESFLSFLPLQIRRTIARISLPWNIRLVGVKA